MRIRVRNPGRGRGRDRRGIVTIEFAFGILATVIVLIMMAWGIFLFATKVAAVDAAGAVARQLARGDASAADRAKRDGPADARYQASIGGGVVSVTTVVAARPLGMMPSFRITARAEAVLEPGQDGTR